MNIFHYLLKRLFQILTILIPLICHGQKQGNVWFFGDHAGLNFNNNPPTPLLTGQTYMCCSRGWNEGCSSISDSSGSLLFYTNGVKIWNRNQQVMPHGDSLMGNPSSTQSSLIVPQPGSSEYFYVFTTDAQENNFQNGLRYSKVDICLDGGFGDVLTGQGAGGSQKNIQLIDTTTEKLACIQHANGTDYWIVVHKFLSDAFYSFQLSSTGVSPAIISHTGLIDSNGVGQMNASPNGLKIGYAVPSGGNGFTLLADFDPLTGVVSNAQSLVIHGTEYAVSFSPDNSKLYFSTAGHGNVYQYNLNAGNMVAIIASRYDFFYGPDSWRQMQLGPDGKLYLSRSGKSYVSAIEYPNNLGAAAIYTDSAIYLGGKLTSFGLPNFIAGYNYSNTFNNCVVTGFNETSKTPDDILSQNIPNPASDFTRIDYKLPDGSKGGEIIMYDLLGKEINRYNLVVSANSITISVADIPAGTYYYQLQTSGSSTAGKKLVVIK